MYAEKNRYEIKGFLKWPATPEAKTMISGVIIVSINESCVNEGFKAGPFLQFLWVPRSDRDL